jgi:hypothetical protein
MEVSFSPNLELITLSSKNFVDEVFNCLYFGEENNVTRVI